MKKQPLTHFFTAFILVYIYVCLFSFNPRPLYAQAVGLKYYRNYGSGKHPMNRSVVQDKRGVIYVANDGGVLELDGVSQRIIAIPNVTVLSLAVDESDRVYVGGVNEFGYLAPDPNGMRQYVSLVNHLKENQKNISQVWRINTTTDGVWFRTYKFLFRWDPQRKKMDAWTSALRFNASFSCNGKLFVHQRRIGLMQMIDGSLKMIAGNENLAPVKVYMIAPYAPGSTDASAKILIGTRSKGFYIYDGREAVPFATEADEYVKENQLYHGIRLTSSPGEFALATLRGGLVIINADGKLKRIFNKTSGLQDDNV
ncbi:MAG: hypothetical protein GY940_27475, partial [bacterium]|nr:hypothetical protein [bacterium]